MDTKEKNRKKTQERKKPSTHLVLTADIMKYSDPDFFSEMGRYY